MSFARILRSSALMGGAQVVVLAAGFVRAKAIALIFGASGVGLIGIFQAFSGNVASFAGWGLGTSGVRLIAGAPDELKPAKVAAVRRMGWVLSLLGLALALLLFWPVGIATFASSQYATEMAIVACAVPCVIASSAWSAVLQASGKVASLAKVQIAAALAGLLMGLPAIWLWGALGIALSIMLATAVPAFLLWRAARVECQVSAGASAESEDLGRLVKLGGALMLVGWLGQLSAYLVRLAIVRQEGLDAAGYYQAAFAISGSLPGFVFAAMGADFFPRVAAAKDETEARSITEKQILAGLLLGVPLIIAMLTLGKLSVRLLYADTFDAAIPLLAWMTWGVFARLVAWPLGFWMMARRSPRAFMVVEGVACLISLVLPVMFMGRMGLVGAAVGFFWSAILYAILLVCLLCRGAGMSPGVGTVKAVLLAILAVCACQWLGSLSDHLYFGVLPTMLAAAGCFWCYRRIITKEDEARVI
jgi:enterobacterial common antigen flippase